MVCLSASDELTLVAPNVFHYGVTETVLVTSEAVTGETDVEVYLEAWPTRSTPFSISRKVIPAKSRCLFSYFKSSM